MATASDSTSSAPRDPVLVFAASGATWKILHPLLEANRLPNLRRLRDRGVWGVLESVKTTGDKHFRPQTAGAALSTGCLPERNGLTRFFHTAENITVPTLWDYFLQNGDRVGLYGWPMTWPPPKLNGFVIPCHHARDSSTWPQTLSTIKALDRQQQDAEREGSSASPISTALAVARLFTQIRPPVSSMIPIARTAVETTISRDREARQLLLRRGKLELSAALFLTLCKRYRPRLAMFGSFYIDMVEHSCWRHFEPDKFPDQPTNSKLRNAIERAYECTDAALGRILNGMPRNTLVAFVSEHGMSADVSSSEVGNRRYRIRAGPVKTLAELPEDVTASPIARWIAFRHNRGESYSEELVRRLSEITVVESGLPLFQVYRSGPAEVVIKFNLHKHVDVYRQVALEELSIRRGDRVVGFIELARHSGELRSGMHDGEAVMILSGSRIRPLGEITGATVLDVVPTILAVSGLRVPETLDGKVLDVMV